MKAALYLRVSTEEQASGGHSIEAQRQELIKYCDAFDYEIYNFYVDGGFSASTMDRPALKKLLADCGKYDLALVWRLDRISRDMADLMKILEVFTNDYVIFKSKTENFDTSTASGKLMLNMLGSFAEFERASISERIQLAHRKILNEGKWRGGKPPLGYTINEDKTLEINENESLIAKKIFDLSANENMGTRSIAIHLNALGYLTRNHKPFTSTAIVRILKNPTYYGEMIHKRQQYVKKNGKKTVVYTDEYHTFKGLYSPIISKELFLKSEENMNRRKLNRGASSKIPNLLSGIIFCGDCKEYMLRNSKKTGEIFFTCKSYKHYGKCRHHYISENVVMKEIKKSIQNIEASQNMVYKMNKKLVEEKKHKLHTIRNELTTLQDGIRSISRRKDKLFELVEKEIITETDFIDRKKKLSKEQEEKSKLLKQLQSNINNINNYQGNKNFMRQLTPFHEKFDTLSFETKKKILNKIIERIEVFDNDKAYARKKIHIYYKI
ncbi:recombinase family protein [Marinisporobacter balticus]|uniref:Site-specific DNA recombinase n=1 Tax=Marinisporobacter balticus TaxID=2018667 RepID=A0A4R2K5I0_9FIRM|nr:recombinase family protein [Marinisporobacter balticus]TCO68491.1 site-specific DNA recombinase [Marinisporobacter balticus]